MPIYPFPESSGDSNKDNDNQRAHDAIKKLPLETVRQLKIENPRVLSLTTLIDMVPEASKAIQEFDEGKIAPYPYQFNPKDLDAIVKGFSEDLQRLFKEQLQEQKRGQGLPDL